MLAMVMNVNIFVVGGIALVSAIVGFLARGNKHLSLKKKITDLENEVLVSHAEILQLQKEKIDLLKSISQPNIPVIPITGAKDEKNSDKIPDVSARKKLLGSQNTPNIKQQSGS